MSEEGNDITLCQVYKLSEHLRTAIVLLSMNIPEPVLATTALAKCTPALTIRTVIKDDHLRLLCSRMLALLICSRNIARHDHRVTRPLASIRLSDRRPMRPRTMVPRVRKRAVGIWIPWLFPWTSRAGQTFGDTMTRLACLHARREPERRLFLITPQSARNESFSGMPPAALPLPSRHSCSCSSPRDSAGPTPRATSPSAMP